MIKVVSTIFKKHNFFFVNVGSYRDNNNNNNRSLFVATRVKKQTKNKVKDLTSKLGTRMETGRL